VGLLQRLLRRIGDEDQAERLFALDLLLRANLETGDTPAAAGLLPEIEAIAAAVGTMALKATALSATGLVQLARGATDDACSSFEDAIDLLLAGDAAFAAARVRLDCADALERLGRLPAAVQQAMLAQTAFARLGAAHYRAAASQLVERLNAGLGRPPVGATLPYGLTAREAEVLWLIAAGKTNQDIARELVLSIRTVERHISTVYEKLGLQGRAARASAASIAVSLRANT
jgi:DNA-binding NarL/FixJ family response regulator